MLNIGPPELILIFVIALVVVGPQRLPELGRTIGKGLREFRRMQDEVKDLVNTGMGDDFKQTTAELKRTAADLKSATDVRSAFRDEAPRSQPHRPRPAANDETGEPPVSDSGLPDVIGPAEAEPGTEPMTDPAAPGAVPDPLEERPGEGTVD
jgi:Tat protein translocase TatB subunit